MRKITINKADYDDIVYAAVAMDTPKTTKEVQVCSDVLAKLEEVGHEMAESVVNPATGETVENETFKMNDVATVIEFENAEADYMSKRLVEVLPQIQARRSRKMLPLLEELERKEEVKEKVSNK